MDRTERAARKNIPLDLVRCRRRARYRNAFSRIGDTREGGRGHLLGEGPQRYDHRESLGLHSQCLVSSDGADGMSRYSTRRKGRMKPLLVLRRHDNQETAGGLSVHEDDSTL